MIAFSHSSFSQDKNHSPKAIKTEDPTPEEIAKLEIYALGQAPTRPYQLISPISAKKDNEETSFGELIITAVRLKADAIIDYKCGPVTEESLWTGANRVRSYCNGKAVNWSHEK